ncbi:peptidase C39 [Lysobacter arseniciresistens ZS79]|uniref:Peptidase C39 n=1 Tax=Lysobacter arseniciresistens ZS79 TaxID=913325 RepID=A0A0A0EV16_9GAMM|nr:C39 family peptidase [Lysobacter arseniciresistens]KGM54105.1 peptidase C39 [Lysobacter arseniciresistens ZS79]
MRAGILAPGLALALALALPCLATASSLGVRTPQGGAYMLKVTSLKEARYATTVPQQYDFSCGSAATATLLTYQYGHPVSEQDVFVRMYRDGDRARIRAEGFSLLDMRRYLESLGFVADGFELPLDKLEEEGLPAIVLLNDRGYRHFVVVKGVRDGRVLLGDPARGTRAMSRERFEALWDNGVLFVIHNRRELAGFNQPRDWRTAPPAPLQTGVGRRGLGDVVIPKFGPGDS